MTLSYLLRLLCLCFSSFFLLNAASSFLLCLLSRKIARCAQSGRAAAAARLLMGLRLLPFLLALLGVFVLDVPSYFRLEPRGTSEYVGWPCIVLAFLGLATCCVSFFRSTRAIASSLSHARRCARTCLETRFALNSPALLVLDSERPLLALSGLFRPRLLVSSSLLQRLSSEELDAAFFHEEAHRSSYDNLKRLLMLVTPDPLPFVNLLSGLERDWSTFTEWAADDRVAAGNSRRALSLASALVRVAQLGAAPALPTLATSLLAGDRDLQARVDRLLQPVAEPQSSSRAYPLLRLAALFLTTALVASLFVPSTLHFVHELQELLLH
jgi:beta-lactamase regulating signal transducer with metallopeptidase domain